MPEHYNRKNNKDQSEAARIAPPNKKGKKWGDMDPFDAIIRANRMLDKKDKGYINDIPPERKKKKKPDWSERP